MFAGLGMLGVSVVRMHPDSKKPSGRTSTQTKGVFYIALRQLEAVEMGFDQVEIFLAFDEWQASILRFMGCSPNWTKGDVLSPWARSMAYERTKHPLRVVLQLSWIAKYKRQKLSL